MNHRIEKTPDALNEIHLCLVDESTVLKRLPMLFSHLQRQCYAENFRNKKSKRS